MENFFNTQRILDSIWKWKIHIIIVLVLAIVASAIFSSSLFITPKFKSTARLYPVNIAEYSEESESEQLLELIRTSDLQFQVIDAFELDKVYKISKEDPLYQTYMMYEYSTNVSFKKTEFETIEIKVLDEDPQRACNMVDSIIVFFNHKMRRLHGAKYMEVANIAQRDYHLKNNEIDSLQQIVEMMSKQYGILDYDLQVEKATEGMMNAAIEGRNSKPAANLIESLKEQGNRFRYIQNQLKRYENVADSLKMEYDWAISNATKDVTYSIIAERPFVADKKVYPVRWLIVFLTVIATFAVSIITTSMIDYFGDKKSA